MRRSNCLVFALAARWRLGGRILMRRSQTPWRVLGFHLHIIPHFLWQGGPRKRVVSLVPISRPRVIRTRYLWYVALFPGRVQWGFTKH